MIFLYFCKFFVPRSEGPPLTLYRPGDSQDYQSFDFFYFLHAFEIRYLKIIYAGKERHLEETQWSSTFSMTNILHLVLTALAIGAH